MAVELAERSLAAQSASARKDSFRCYSSLQCFAQAQLRIHRDWSITIAVRRRWKHGPKSSQGRDHRQRSHSCCSLVLGLTTDQRSFGQFVSSCGLYSRDSYLLCTLLLLSCIATATPSSSSSSSAVPPTPPDLSATAASADPGADASSSPAAAGAGAAGGAESNAVKWSRMVSDGRSADAVVECLALATLYGSSERWGSGRAGSLRVRRACRAGAQRPTGAGPKLWPRTSSATPTPWPMCCFCDLPPPPPLPRLAPLPPF